MANYAIGDVQGCYQPLQQLLKTIRFEPHRDRLWFVGDLVNRGPDSLRVLRFIKQLPIPPIIVLGNHDLHLLTVVNGCHSLEEGDTLDDIFNAPDKWELLDWLRQQPLIYHDSTFDIALVHAGIPPQWTLAKALSLANEVESQLRSKNYVELLSHLYGNEPTQWNDQLTGWDRLRLITNYLTRMRFCTKEGELCLQSKGAPGTQPEHYYPWFDIESRASASKTILFGHWASLEGKAHSPTVYALDTGCLWGGKLSALRLEDQQWFRVQGLRIDK